RGACCESFLRVAPAACGGESPGHRPGSATLAARHEPGDVISSEISAFVVFFVSARVPPEQTPDRTRRAHARRAACGRFAAQSAVPFAPRRPASDGTFMGDIAILGLDHVVLRTKQLDRILRFYRDALGCPVERTIEPIGLYQLRAGAALV